MRDEMDALRTRGRRDDVEKLGKTRSGRFDDLLVGEIAVEVALRGPAVHHRRAVEIQIIGELCRPPRGILERLVEAVNEDEHVLAG